MPGTRTSAAFGSSAAGSKTRGSVPVGPQSAVPPESCTCKPGTSAASSKVSILNPVTPSAASVRGQVAGSKAVMLTAPATARSSRRIA